MPLEDRKEVLAVAADKLGRPAYLLEKDVWVVGALAALTEAPFGQDLVFKGGTSLSKAHKAITRFSEDVDLTYDIRKLTPERGQLHPDGLPNTSSAAKKWSAEVRDRLPDWIRDNVVPALESAMVDLEVAIEHQTDTVLLAYPPLADHATYVAPSVRLEFGARSTGEPATEMDVACDIESLFSDIDFPTARPRVMYAERTFWEKATAIHVLCVRAMNKHERSSRHWHDIIRLYEAGVVHRAIGDRDLAAAVATHKSLFFREPGVDYNQAVGGALRLVPDEGRDKLESDYSQMFASGILPEGSESFDELLEKAATIQDAANKAAHGDH